MKEGVYGTVPPRTREGQEYPGGKSLRRAYKRLKLRRDGVQGGKCPDKRSHTNDSTPWGSYGYTKPGSMKG